jgi:hypothetical protein
MITTLFLVEKILSDKERVEAALESEHVRELMGFML